MDILNKTNQINQYVKEASIVFLMAHRDLDLDAINSCIAMNYYVNSLGKKAFIVVDDVHHELGVKKVLDLEKKNVSIIKSSKVAELKDDMSLLIVLDTSKSKITQNPDIIGSFKNVINIDHHDKTKESLKASLQVIDEDASSTCEMLSCLFKECNLKIPKRLATLLLAGIVLDTNHYRLKTDVNTFYTSYYLMRCGAKVNDINELLRQDLRNYVKQEKIISSVKVFKNIAIGRGTQRNEYKKEELAKTADILMTFSKIKASFVVAKISKDAIGISGRSNGDVNVGKILEQFGGGGGESEAAATIENASIKKVLDELLNYIKNC